MPPHVKAIIAPLLAILLISCDDGTGYYREKINELVPIGTTEQVTLEEVTGIGWIYTYDPLDNSYLVYDPKQNENTFVRVGIKIYLDDQRKVKNINIRSFANFM
ncbi:hypothetical protein [Thalassospira lucentensis]|uniref:Lipoprotein SmpA/OmlA domain-containing protein n=1 Tax=Thalassospira lucentensis TaxID=168935 RepID=A0A358HQ75_9PROT|nr:hypothetical protein [Thalassospira lucentensis]HBU97337.1 hypothetical protein [Thalassospira lucentensis]